MITRTLSPYKPPQRGFFNFRTGAIASASEALIIAGVVRLEEERTAHSVILRWTDGCDWRGAALNWSSRACCVARRDPAQWCILGIDGEAGILRGVDLEEGTVGAQSLYAVASAASKLHAVGVGGQHFVSHDGASWRPYHTMHPGKGPLLEAVTAIDDDEVYAVGAEGSVVLASRGRSTLIETPTNVVLAGVCLGPDDLLYACGQRGVVLRGRGHVWTVVEHTETSDDLWSVCAFQGRVFAASARVLYEVTGSSLRKVEIRGDRPTSFYHLNSFGDGALLSVGQFDVSLFDGDRWRNLC
jgi:hypothetical protein